MPRKSRPAPVTDSPEALRAWLRGMRETNAVVWEEARRASSEQRLGDLGSLHRALSHFPPDERREAEARAVADRWAVLRKRLRARG